MAGLNIKLININDSWIYISIHSFITKCTPFDFSQCVVKGIVNLQFHAKDWPTSFGIRCPAMHSGEFNEGHCVKLQKHLINLRQVSKATMHGQHAQILLPHFVHSKQFMFLVLVKWLFPVTRVQLMSLQRHWHSHHANHANHAKIWCSLHSHHWALSS